LFEPANKQACLFVATSIQAGLSAITYWQAEKQGEVGNNRICRRFTGQGFPGSLPAVCPAGQV